MTGTHTQNPTISRITLALMEDTGWYKANYSMAQPMTWGKGLGCEFVMKSCKEWISSKSARYDCKKSFRFSFLNLKKNNEKRFATLMIGVRKISFKPKVNVLIFLQKETK